MYFSFYNIHALTKTRALQSNSLTSFSLFLSFSPFSSSSFSIASRETRPRLSLSQSSSSTLTTQRVSLFHHSETKTRCSLYLLLLSINTRITRLSINPNSSSSRSHLSTAALVSSRTRLGFPPSSKTRPFSSVGATSRSSLCCD